MILRAYPFKSHVLITYGKVEILKYNYLYVKGVMQAKGILKQDPEANIWAQEG
jgi:hypothetical protein